MEYYSLQHLLENTEVCLMNRETGDKYDTWSTEVEIDLTSLGIRAEHFEITQFDIDIVHNKERDTTFFINATPYGTDDYEIYLWFNDILGPRLMDMFLRTIHEFVREKQSLAESFMSDDDWTND
ncbi:hypothetical protein QI30_16510 [Kurthia sp. 3B1D]|uniref:Uncharacterized protein n=2 Tax=Kurthia TaxID=1649 RepID=A0A433RPS1_9BACL|nr:MULTISPECIES: hypothetical protein [unclassified Kurthia]RUS52375.1 hypothetical protein QI30_16510 [Kurthia sp. 3B1D]HIX43397.1 hypothetical protein [Candidatus Kurthia intestinigallinarum]